MRPQRHSVVAGWRATLPARSLSRSQSSVLGARSRRWHAQPHSCSSAPAASKQHQAQQAAGYQRTVVQAEGFEAGCVAPQLVRWRGEPAALLALLTALSVCTLFGRRDSRAGSAAFCILAPAVRLGRTHMRDATCLLNCLLGMLKPGRPPHQRHSTVRQRQVPSPATQQAEAGPCHQLWAGAAASSGATHAARCEIRGLRRACTPFQAAGGCAAATWPSMTAPTAAPAAARDTAPPRLPAVGGASEQMVLRLDAWHHS